MSISIGLREEILSNFGKQNPDGSNFAITDVEEFEGGWERPIHGFTLTYEIGGRRVDEWHVLRSYPGVGGAQAALKDFSIMTQAQQEGIPTPSLDFVIAPVAADAAYLIMEGIQGSQAASAIREEGHNLLAEMAAYQVALHSLTPERFWDWGNIVEPKDFLNAKLSELHRQTRVFDHNDFGKTLDWVESKAADVNEFRISITHNDYHPENVLVRSTDGAIFIIDWGFAAPGEPRMDLAWTLLQISNMLEEKARSSYLAAYEEGAGPVEQLEVFEALKFTERMATIARWLQPGFQPPIPKISQKAIRSSYKIHVLNVYRRLKEITGERIAIIEEIENG